MKKALAGFVTLVAVAMTAVAAWDRGGTLLDKVLLVCLSVVIVLGVHLIPALSRRSVAWLVWVGCLFCAIFGHLTFLTHSTLRAADIRSQQSAKAVGVERQIETIRASLDSIQARPVAQVAAELALENDKRVRSALRTEIDQGKRAEGLRDELARLEAIRTDAHVTGSTDPVIQRISAVTGITEDAVTVTIGMAYALLLELVGMVLWLIALRPESPIVTKKVTVTTPVTGVTDSVTEEVTALINAVKVGDCRATVSGIREFLACSQNKARELRQELVKAKVVPA